MFRLQTAKLPATVLAYLPRLRNQTLWQAQKFVSHATAKLFCGIELMLLLSKHSQFAREAAVVSPASLSFTSVGLTPRKCTFSRRKTVQKRFLNRYWVHKVQFPNRLVLNTKVSRHKL